MKRYGSLIEGTTIHNRVEFGEFEISMNAFTISCKYHTGHVTLTNIFYKIIKSKKNYIFFVIELRLGLLSLLGY